MKIELFLNSDKGRVLGDGVASLPPLRRVPSEGDSWHVKKVFVGFSEKEKGIRDQLEHIAEQHNIELKVYDVTKTSHAFRAWFKGVRDTPMIIIGDHKFGGDFKDNEILSALED